MYCNKSFKLSYSGNSLSNSKQTQYNLKQSSKDFVGETDKLKANKLAKKIKIKKRKKKNKAEGLRQLISNVNSNSEGEE